MSSPISILQSCRFSHSSRIELGAFWRASDQIRLYIWLEPFDLYETDARVLNLFKQILMLIEWFWYDVHHRRHPPVSLQNCYMWCDMCVERCILLFFSEYWTSIMNDIQNSKLECIIRLLRSTLTWSGILPDLKS